MKLKNSMKIIALSVVASTLFVGCGGSSDDAATPLTPVALTGTFVDAPVQGLHFQTPTQSGFTDVSGQFKYKAGEEVEFKLGNLILGKGVASGLVTPYSISENNDTATNIALVLQNCDGNRSNNGILDLSKLKDFNFTLSDFNLSASANTMESTLNMLLATGSFQALVDDNNYSLINTAAVKTVMDAYLDANSVAYDKKFTQSYLDTVNFYMVDDEDGAQRMRFRDGERQIVGDGDSSVNGGYNATFDNPNDFYITPYTLSDGNLNISFGEGTDILTVSFKIASMTETDFSVTGTVTTSNVSIFPVGMTKNETWYTDKTTALENFYKQALNKSGKVYFLENGNYVESPYTAGFTTSRFNVSGEGSPASLPYSVIDGYLKVDWSSMSDPDEYHTIISVDSQYIYGCKSDTLLEARACHSPNYRILY